MSRSSGATTFDLSTVSAASWKARLAALSRSVPADDPRIALAQAGLSYWRLRTRLDHEVAAGHLTAGFAATVDAIVKLRTYDADAVLDAGLPEPEPEPEPTQNLREAGQPVADDGESNSSSPPPLAETAREAGVVGRAASRAPQAAGGGMPGRPLLAPPPAPPIEQAETQAVGTR